MNRVFVASTPMIALACAAAARVQGGRARLILLEDFDLAERLQALLEGWRDNPFEAIVRLPGRHTEHLRGARDRGRGVRHFLHRGQVKRDLRRETLSALRRLDADFAPAQVWLGNDRKVETQLLLHRVSTRTGTLAGRYLDDGLYTYLGDVRQRPWVRRVDAFVKRRIYGRWWQQVAHAGTSRWIAETWLAFPALAPQPPYRRQRIRPLPRSWFANRAFLRLSLDAARTFGVDRTQLRSCDAVWVLPHSNQLRDDPAFAQSLRQAVADAAAQGSRIALKYHPRETDPDPGQLLQAGAACVLPALIPMELLLPLLPDGARLLGEGSTALLAAHWLRPDLQVVDLGLARGGYAARARDLFARAGIDSLARESASQRSG